MDWKRLLRYWMLRIKRMRGDPHKVSLGIAIGVFISITPTIPFHTFIAVSLAYLFRGNKLAAALGVWVSNPLTIPLFYYGSYKLGVKILGTSFAFEPKCYSVLEFMKMGYDITITMIIGGVILGIIPGVISYFITFKMIKYFRQRRYAKERRTF